MINVLFICHGNICRSPTAEYIFRDMVQRQGLAERFHIASAATSREEIGSDLLRRPMRMSARAHSSLTVMSSNVSSAISASNAAMSAL